MDNTSIHPPIILPVSVILLFGYDVIIDGSVGLISIHGLSSVLREIVSYFSYPLKLSFFPTFNYCVLETRKGYL